MPDRPLAGKRVIDLTTAVERMEQGTLGLDEGLYGDVGRDVVGGRGSCEARQHQHERRGRERLRAPSHGSLASGAQGFTSRWTCRRVFGQHDAYNRSGGRATRPSGRATGREGP